jgi:hypothetical protein
MQTDEKDSDDFTFVSVSPITICGIVWHPNNGLNHNSVRLHQSSGKLALKVIA